MGENTGHCRGTHQILSIVLLTDSSQIQVRCRRCVGRNTGFVNLRVGWKFVKVGVKVVIELDDLRSGIYARLLDYHIQVVL